MENSIDAGATHIKLVIQEAGKKLIQVIDNGKGMSPTDARMCLERHATSKIRNAEDLFYITTMGFRGEAIASVVAVAQCEVKTKQRSDELATYLKVEGSKVLRQEPCTGSNGTTITVKNLFFNIPARRKFLKKNAIENRHIIDQFERIALVHPDIEFEFYQDNELIFHIKPGTFRQRLVAVFGKNYNDRLVPVNESTDIVTIKGFICKPEFARKTRGEQYFFVNGRFIKNHYLHHGVQQAFEELIPKGFHPSYFLQLECDPSTIDINIHPTKTEIKFEDEKSVYAIIRSAVKKALGEHNIAPSLDFNRETSFDQLEQTNEISPPGISVNPEFNPFDTTSTSNGSRKMDYSAINPSYSTPVDHWESLIDQSPTEVQTDIDFKNMDGEFIVHSEAVQTEQSEEQSESKIFQLHHQLILIQIKSGLMMIDQQRAHERILFDRYLGMLANENGPIQQLLFPQNIDLNAVDADLLNELLPQLRCMGFDIEEFGKNAFIVRGMPAEVSGNDAKTLLESILENYKLNDTQLKVDARVNLALSLAQNAGIKKGRKLEKIEMQNLVDELFACETPNYDPSGKSIIQTLKMDELIKRFE